MAAGTSVALLCGLGLVLSAGFAQIDSGAAIEHYRRASKAFIEQKFDPAIDDLNKSLALNPHQLPAIRLLGLCYQLVNKLDQAETAFLRACRLAPKDAESWFYLGRVYYNRNFFDKALSALKTAVKYAPNDARIRECLGLTHEALGHADAALRELEEAIRCNTGPPGSSATLYLNYGALLLKLNRMQESEQALAKAVSLAPASWQARFELAKLYHQTDRFEAALRELTASLEVKSTAEESARTLRLMAGVYSRLARHQDAQKAMAAAEK